MPSILVGISIDFIEYNILLQYKYKTNKANRYGKSSKNREISVPGLLQNDVSGRSYRPQEQIHGRDGDFLPLLLCESVKDWVQSPRTATAQQAGRASIRLVI